MNSRLNHPKHPVPRWIRLAIFALVVVNVFALIVRSRGVDFRYWYDGLALAILLIVASALLLMDEWWSQLLASSLTAPMVLWFCYAALKVHEVLPSSPGERQFLRDSASWREFLIWYHPDVLLQYVLATVVVGVGLIYVIQYVFWKRATLRTGG